MKLLFIFLSIFILSKKVFSQTKINLEWEESLEVNNGQELSVLSIKDQSFEGFLPLYYKQFKVAKNKKLAIKIASYTTSLVEDKFEKQFTLSNKQIKSQIEFSVKNTFSRTQKNANFILFPFLKEDGKIKKIESIDLIITELNDDKLIKKDFVSSSILGIDNADWYKLSVKQDGVYQLSYSFLQSIGVDVDNLNPNHVHVFGNGFGKLPESNSVFRPDDLQNNSLAFVGDADNVFEADEYFKFYGWGPNKLKNSGTIFSRDLHIYSDDSYYFIAISSNINPQRIQEIDNSSLSTDAIITTFNHYDIYEQELKNLVSGGQRWYGDEFDIELSKNFTFTIPNIVTSDTVIVKSSFASNARLGSNTITYRLNNQVIYQSNLPTASIDYGRKEFETKVKVSSSSLPINITVNRSSPDILTYLDKIEINATRSCVHNGGQLNFRNTKAIGKGVCEYLFTNVSSNSKVWNISDLNRPYQLKVDLQSNSLSFKESHDSLLTYVIYNENSLLQPSFVKRVEKQNLHSLAYADLLIVTHSDFIQEANRLAILHEQDGTSSHVVTTEQVYNEFSSGMMDPTAIRWFAKMFYDRAAGDVSKMPENLLLFGDGTYDPKNRVAGNNNFIPTYQVINSEDHINAMVTDDYFGMLDDSESLASSDEMDIGVGRMIVSSSTQATEMVNKIEQYLKKGLKEPQAICNQLGQNCSSFGDWRQRFVQMTDDEENGYFIINDTEPQVTIQEGKDKQYTVDKFYTDAFPQVTTAGGERYPEVKELINDRIRRGVLFVNYVGHGGEVGLAEERIVDIPQIQAWDNACNLNFFVSATCEFTRFDDPERVSAGEWVYLNPSGGSIALMTTTRSVYFNVNTSIGLSFFNNVFNRESDGRPKTFGEIMRLTKNQASASSNKRSFNLIGDPALRIALPYQKIVLDSINGIAINAAIDTLKALSKVRLSGHVENNQGQFLNDFNGFVQPSVFDKKKTISTLGQNEKSPIIPFEVQKNILYKGNASVKNGRFDFSFIVPKDIRYDYGSGKVSFYANDANQDAGGYNDQFIVGGVNENGLNDNEGPEIELYFNTDEFVDGGLTDANPTLIAKLFDENGINTVGNGIGHDLLAIIDNETSNPIILNEFYNADLDTYQSGEVRYRFSELAEGNHTLTLKAWDVNNNLSQKEIAFEVRNSGDFQLSHVLNYPNPFTTSTEFFFEHNQLCSNLEVLIQVFTVSGKLVKTLTQDIYNECYRSEGISWDGRDDFGDQLARGVYIYRLQVRNPEGKIAEKLEKLVILK